MQANLLPFVNVFTAFFLGGNNAVRFTALIVKL